MSCVVQKLTQQEIEKSWTGNAKLTHFLKDSLNENYNILLLLHLSPQIKDLPETISTLQFGERIVKICHHKTGKEKIQFINAAK